MPTLPANGYLPAGTLSPIRGTPFETRDTFGRSRRETRTDSLRSSIITDGDRGGMSYLGRRLRRSVYKNPAPHPHFALEQKSSSDELAMQYQLEALATCAAAFVFVILRRRRRRSAITDVPGPESPSWIFGTSPEGQPHSFSLPPVGRPLKGFKDTSGTSWPKKLGEWRRGTSRSSGTSSVGRVLLEYVSPAIKLTPVSSVWDLY